MHKRFKVLAVDDEPINLRVVIAALKDEYDIFTALSGHDAIDQLEEHKPDLVLLDVMMPDLNGFEVCKIIKADDRFANIPVIFMTALDTNEGALQGFELGAIDYLAKPVNIELLKLRVRNHIALKDQRDQLVQQKEKLDQLLVEQELQNKQIQQTQKLESLGVLAGGIAHDFNNILMAIMGNAELALMRINKESPAVDNLQRIIQSSVRAADLAKQMLAYSGKGKFVVEHIDMSCLVEEMHHMLEVSISKKAVFRFNLTRPIPSVKGDATQLRQVIMNLVINASEAIGDNSGVIVINTGYMECDKNYLKNVWLDDNLAAALYVSLEVSDSGCGMDSDTLAKLFDPFFTTKFTGRGLGMAATLGIVRGHKGAIRVSSEPGKGTSFKILLPTADRPPEDAQVDKCKGNAG